MLHPKVTLQHNCTLLLFLLSVLTDPECIPVPESKLLSEMH
ncbi:hypothetical protein SAMN04488121_102869 [Chitinophaga filiformis]|uniref:Uncharacterized protein n=1 Tax=Chitinophaga filiformis TaxID=104663 RepID=A0A1G7NN83_CHIFI|nr:hypothetical protein SAMN04488121_102869 [Chitinophaga filiformis]